MMTALREQKESKCEGVGSLLGMLSKHSGINRRRPSETENNEGKREGERGMNAV